MVYNPEHGGDCSAVIEVSPRHHNTRRLSQEGKMLVWTNNGLVEAKHRQGRLEAIGYMATQA